jgi:hypothetical protein
MGTTIAESMKTRADYLIVAAGLLVAAGVVGSPASAGAQQLTLTITPAVVTFPSSDPDAAPVLNAAPLTVDYRVRGNGNRPWMLTVVASGDLMAGGSRIAAGEVSWIATPAPPFRSGTMTTTQAQAVASGTGNVNPGTRGTLTFRLANSWTYDAGTYTQMLTFTLSTP